MFASELIVFSSVPPLIAINPLVSELLVIATLFRFDASIARFPSISIIAPVMLILF